MKTPPFPYQLSRHGWISVAYNQNIWIPCPPVFPEGLDRRSWAVLYAEEWWSRTSMPHGKREIRALARTLADIQSYAYRHMPMHLGFLHLPSLNLAPQLVSFGIWEAAGARAEQLRFLTRADDPAFIQPPAVEEFGTANTKVLSWQREAPGAHSVVVSINFTADPQTVSLSVPNSSGKLKTLLKTPGASDPASLSQIQLGPFGVYIGEVQ